MCHHGIVDPHSRRNHNTIDIILIFLDIILEVAVIFGFHQQYGFFFFKFSYAGIYLLRLCIQVHNLVAGAEVLQHVFVGVERIADLHQLTIDKEYGIDCDLVFLFEALPDIFAGKLVQEIDSLLRVIPFQRYFNNGSFFVDGLDFITRKLGNK